MKLATAANVLIPAYLVLCKKGYRITRIIETPNQAETWRAVKADDEFIGEDPLSLLGLVMLVENRGSSWQASDIEIEAFLEEFP